MLRVAPDKREEWVDRQVEQGVDVIITHPKRVETGLDLMQFSTIVWMGISYSIYTVMQASRRSWRIGQEKDVQVYFFNYNETLQHDAMYLIAAKMAASVRVNGDLVQNDSLAELDELTNSVVYHSSLDSYHKTWYYITVLWTDLFGSKMD